jgi:septum formation inhibitor MinC
MSHGTADPADDDGPVGGLFATETMAELSARQGRTADAVAIYRQLVRGAETAPVPDDAALARLARWKARLAELDPGSPAAAGPAAPPLPARARGPVAPPIPQPMAPRDRPSLLVRETVRSGQLIYAEGRDLIVMASVNPGAQLLADGHIHVYAALRGRAIAGARGRRDAQVFCLALDPELVGVDVGYLTNEDIPADLRGGPARVSLTPEGTCSVSALVPGKPGGAGAGSPWRRF